MENSKKLVIDNKRINEILIDKDPGCICMVVEPLFNVNIYAGEEKYETDMMPFTTPQRFVYAITWYAIEVNNGGHLQFYYNSSGIVWEDALEGFKAIGATKNYDILKESAVRMGGNPSKNRANRHLHLNELGDSDVPLHRIKVFNDLDDAYYDSQAAMLELLCAYIKTNAKDFYFSGEVVYD